MSYEVLKKFDDANFVVYALPAHTSGKTQTLDLVAFWWSKVSLVDSVEKVARVGDLESYTTFEFSALLSVVFNTAMTKTNIISGFARTSVLPLDLTHVIGGPITASTSDLDRVLTK